MDSKIIPGISHYVNEKYNTPNRFMSYWYQIHLVDKIVENTKIKNPKILEVGIGNKFFYNYIKYIKKYKITGVDIEPSLDPDYILNIRNTEEVMKIFKNENYNILCAFEILEHIPYKEALKVLETFLSISDYVVISVPDSRYTIKISLKIPGFKEKTFMKKLNIVKKNNIYHKHHYWEIGWKNYPLIKINRDFNKIGKIVYSHTPYIDYEHRFYILSSK